MNKTPYSPGLLTFLILLQTTFFIMVNPVGALTLDEIRLYAIKGSPEAQFTLGLSHEEGRDGLTPDLTLARQWYEKAAAGGNDQARNRLAVMYYNGLGGLDKDVPRAVKLFEVSVAQNNDVAQFMLGTIYYFGAEGVEIDKVKAREFLEKSANQGNPMAQDTLGVMTYNGEGGLTKDPIKAREWYQKAADQNHVSGLMHLSFLHFEGKGGLTKDQFKAEEIMRKAADLGDQKAKDILAVWEEADNQITPLAPPKQDDGNFDGKPVLYKHGGVIVAPPLPEEEVPQLDGPEPLQQPKDNDQVTE
ncbi:MAG: sel1 repeat family protein [Proteobacteria bacterium]|nr:sel1 repeat family protein [Pseudomonadota bacterium]MBU1686236.1 sel1 repeat family protein [Pseudomonadota bacterium]